MPPYSPVSTRTITETELSSHVKQTQNVLTSNHQKLTRNNSFQTKLLWFNIIAISIVHVLALYGLLTFPYIYKPKTILWGFIVGGIGGFGVTAGAHRLWCHRSYKAKVPLRILLMLCYSVAGQNTLYDWVRDHRVHHKYSETDADPHNSNRGFFFAHVGWLMMKKHPEVLRKGKFVDCSDLFEDPVIVFHQKYFTILKLLCCFILPTIVPPLCWEETWYWGFMSQAVTRYCLNLNFTWLVNSAAHMWGRKPYDKNISPVENLAVSIAAMGEGWHNYHHTFPWDYKAAELGKYSVNVTTFWIDLFAKLGWAYDLKSPSRELIKKVVEKRGDGSHFEWGQDELSENETT